MADDPAAGGDIGASGAGRLTEPPDAGRRPRLPFPVVGIGASAGGLEAYTEFLKAAPPDAGMAYVLVQHLPPDRESMLAGLLGKHTRMPVAEVADGQAVEPDRVYVIRPGHTLTIRDGRLHLGAPLAARGHGRPIDDFFRSLAEEQQQRAIAVVLSGMGSNGTAGAEAVEAVGGLVVAQDPESALYPSMPRSLIDANLADFVLRPAEMPEVIGRYAEHPYAVADHPPDAASFREEQALGEILGVLRTRTRHDFAGYRKPTLLRRILRRMGLGHVGTMGEYVKALRQSTAEVAALADDLLIHVTGFFRDPEAWEALREKVIAPLVEDRPDGAPIRAWVTACATGEEAYTLAILLVEAAEQRGKQFDIKVFATDMADRALAHARAGLFAGGIESEVMPERLERFFDRDDSMYRVKRELRELVIFAPQNVLQDPPFSRLDIVTCRNLLIYLEPEVQQRVLALLHFGLREGGALLLGNSESVGPAEEDFQPIDKKLRLFRRVGPTRHGSLEFPLPNALVREVPPVAVPRAITRASVAQSATRLLLEGYTPAAVVVDIQGHIVYFHGDTGRYIDQPRGEPTRELLALANEQVRGAVRTALHKASEADFPVTVRDGIIETRDGRRRVEVGAAVLDPRTGHTHYLVTFRDYPEPVPPTPAPPGDPTAERQLIDELQRVRDELQSTLEEMQTSNEEMKASHEEVTSINEELQSTNEELETSKEELQSLNEELTTVNAQYHAKMAELEATSSDLGSLLSSTDIAVLFLDPRFRIRRYTPAVRDLIDLIPSDVGRPLADLRRKFTDPDLAADSQAVLDRLIPVEKEIPSDSGRTYLRRILPYRTTDNRIDGVVVTFVDISQRLADAAALRASEEQTRLALDAAGMGSFVWYPGDDRTEADARLLDLFGPPPGGTLTHADAMARLVHPDDRDRHEAVLRRALDPAGDGLFRDEIRVRRADGTDRWVGLNGRAEFGGSPRRAVRLFGVAFDVTARKEADERRAFLLRLSDALRPLADPETIPAEACRLLGRQLAADRAYYVEVDEAGEVATVRRDYLRGDSPSLVGRHRVADFGWAVPGMRQGDTLVVRDATTDPRIPDPDRPALAAIRVAAHVHAPLVKGGVLVGAVGVTEPAPRAWTAAEVELVRETAERIWAAVERATAERALAAELAAMTRLQGLSDRLLSATDLPVALGEVLDSAIALHAADMGTAQVYDPAADGLRYAAARGFDATALGNFPLVCRDFHSTCAAAIRIGERVIASDLTTDPRFADHREAAAALGYRAAFSFPLTTRRGEFLGVLTVHFRAPREPADRELQWAAIYARLAAHLIERAQTEAALQRVREGLEARVKERTAELIAAEAGRRELLGRLVTGQEEERRRIARELHDTLGQYLTALGLGLAGARDRAAPAERDRLDRLVELTAATGREVHRLATELRPTALDDLGLRTSLQQKVEAWTARTGVPAEFAARGLNGERFSWQVSTAVYRVVQEALTNVARHARATRVSVVVERGPDFLRAIVEDNGVGFDPAQTPPPGPGGLGLLGMRERVALVNGTLQVESSPENGTTVYVRVPVPPPEAQHE